MPVVSHRKFPTHADRPPKRSKRPSTAGRSSVGKIKSPEIFVRIAVSGWRSTAFARASLRNRDGFLHLTWREAGRVRSFYLGKAKKSFPTETPGAGGPGPRRRRAAAGHVRREKKRSRNAR